jgi:hypothetical protein
MKQSLGQRFGAWFRSKAEAYLTKRRVIHGFPVTVFNTRTDVDTAQVFDRLDQALELISRYHPRLYRRLRHDVAALTVRRYPCRGAFFATTRTCLIELTFTVNPQFTVAEIASCIVHEGTHARIRRPGSQLPVQASGREERVCRRTELEFAKALPAPDGERVVRRARELLQFQDSDLAVDVDWQEAHRRVIAADLEAAPKWVKTLRQWRGKRTA